MARDQDPMTDEELARAREAISEAFDEARAYIADATGEAVPDGDDADDTE